MYIRRRARVAYRLKKGERILLLNDSLATVGALNHGRSPSVLFNAALRKMIPELLCSGITVATVWIPSEANPSDAPSRGTKVWCWQKDVKRGLADYEAWKREKPQVLKTAGGSRDSSSEAPQTPKTFTQHTRP